MALPKPRKLIVDNTEYKWICKHQVLIDHTLPEKNNRIYSQARLYIETSTSKTLIEAIFDSRMIFGYSPRVKYVDYLAITPAVVKAVIHYALKKQYQNEDRKFIVVNPSLEFEEELRIALKKGSRWAGEV